MIKSFADNETQRIFNRLQSRRYHPQLAHRALRKLIILDAAGTIEDLRRPPGNRLEALSGARKGQHSIRINDQWRICFKWAPDGPEKVEITDYH